ncbi:hypothetical protein Patl1_34820 [Pistacia atlantica]|uniref:Uncharacterized protein n=1 Tax=Pistacia atlantica TaxID=434234 RepID=A0ACC0ZTF7_9ROSI|nr:hypothetical protein Patl1_34820 [Pistacia atlantica]
MCLGSTSLMDQISHFGRCILRITYTVKNCINHSHDRIPLRRQIKIGNFLID